MMIRCFFLSAFLIVSCYNLSAQEGRTSDEQLVAQSLDKLLSIVSVEPGSAADTSALRELCLLHCYFTVRMPDGNDTPYQKVDLDKFILLLTDSYYSAGFKEISLGRNIQTFNGIAMAFEAFSYEDSEGDTGRGVNSIQLLKEDGEWKIANVLWTGESEDQPIPEYLIQD